MVTNGWMLQPISQKASPSTKTSPSPSNRSSRHQERRRNNSTWLSTIGPPLPSRTTTPLRSMTRMPINRYAVSITPIIRIDIKDNRIRVTYTVQNYEILSDISGGWLTAVLADERTVGDSKRKADDKTNANLYDKQWEIARHYPFVQNDAQKRTCAKALVMTHAYSNAVIDKIEEAVKNGIVGNEDEDW